MRPRSEVPGPGTYLFWIAMVALFAGGLYVLAVRNFGPDRMARLATAPGNIVFERVTLRPDRIVVHLRNAGSTAALISQVAINQALWDFAISPGVKVPGRARAVLSANYPWDEGFPVEVKVITSKGKSFAHLIPAPVATPSDRVSDRDRGAAVYVERCYACHGADGSGHGPRGVFLGRKVPDLREGVSRKTDSELGAVISDGRGWMPAFKFALTDPERRSVLKFVRSFK